MPDKLSMLHEQWIQDLLAYQGLSVCVDSRTLKQVLDDYVRISKALPRTADGVTIVPGQIVFDSYGDDHKIDEVYHNKTVDYYSTREAAERARER